MIFKRISRWFRKLADYDDELPKEDSKAQGGETPTLKPFPDFCPKCGSRYLLREQRRNLIGYKCRKCGNIFDVKPRE